MKGSEKGGEKEGQENWKVDISFKEKKKRQLHSSNFNVQREIKCVYTTLHAALHLSALGHGGPKLSPKFVFGAVSPGSRAQATGGFTRLGVHLYK